MKKTVYSLVLDDEIVERWICSHTGGGSPALR